MLCNVHENNAMSSSFDSSLKTCYFANVFAVVFHRRHSSLCF